MKIGSYNINISAWIATKYHSFLNKISNIKSGINFYRDLWAKGKDYRMEVTQLEKINNERLSSVEFESFMRASTLDLTTYIGLEGDPLKLFCIYQLHIKRLHNLIQDLNDAKYLTQDQRTRLEQDLQQKLVTTSHHAETSLKIVSKQAQDQAFARQEEQQKYLNEIAHLKKDLAETSTRLEQLDKIHHTEIAELNRKRNQQVHDLTQDYKERIQRLTTLCDQVSSENKTLTNENKKLRAANETYSSTMETYTAKEQTFTEERIQALAAADKYKTMCEALEKKFTTEKTNLRKTIAEKNEEIARLKDSTIGMSKTAKLISIEQTRRWRILCADQEQYLAHNHTRLQEIMKSTLELELFQSSIVEASRKIEAYSEQLQVDRAGFLDTSVHTNVTEADIKKHGELLSRIAHAITEEEQKLKTAQASLKTVSEKLNAQLWDFIDSSQKQRQALHEITKQMSVHSRHEAPDEFNKQLASENKEFTTYIDNIREAHSKQQARSAEESQVLLEQIKNTVVTKIKVDSIELNVNEIVD